MRTLDCSHGIVCCFVTQPQTSGQGILPRWSQCLYLKLPPRTTVLWRSMSSLCVSIKIRQFGWKGAHASSSSLFCPSSWKSRNEESGRHAPRTWAEYMTCRNRSFQRAHFTPRWRGLFILRTIKITFHPWSLCEAPLAEGEIGCCNIKREMRDIFLKLLQLAWGSFTPVL